MKSLLNRLRIFPLFWKIPLILVIGLMLLGWLLNTPAGLLGKADAVGYAVCHRIDLRSYHLGDRALPLCSRCTGMYLGALLGLGFQYVLHRRASGTPHWSVIVILSILVLGFAVDGINSYLTFFPGVPHLYQPQNNLRLLSGSGMGIVISAALYPAFNETMWKDADPSPALQNLFQIFGLIFLTIGMDLLIMGENPLILYPLALLSAASVMLLLTMIYSMVWVMLFNKENTFMHLHDLAFPLIAGFGLALLQVIFIDAGRFLLTGTWNGFHIGWLNWSFFFNHYV
ncbi:MAG: DUF2085 domain-containing protein [Anaerolineales bacterium]